MAKKSLRITARFAVVLAVLIPTVLAIIIVGINGLRSGRDVANGLYTDHLQTTQNVAALEIALEDAHQTSLEALLTNGAAAQQRLIDTLALEISPRVEAALNLVSVQTADDPTERPATRAIVTGWAQFDRLLITGALTGGSHAAGDVTQLFDHLNAESKSIIAVEATQSAQAHRQALAVYRSSVELMLIVGLIGLLAASGVVIWLIRSVLPRTLAYSTFATKVSEGQYDARIQPTGNDELAQLGRVLDELAQRRQIQETFDRNQLELLDTLQTAESEDEARDLLRRHLERTVTDTKITILNRNNSADRLQAVTPVDPTSPLVAGLESAKPRSCLAVRKGRPHKADGSAPSLLGCAVCSGCPGETTCTPLVVGGEVIGSVLANHGEPLDELGERSIREAVAQAAPVIGNLRNLALAELRAATDSLTGLPNKRSVHDTLRRMAAQATRSSTPLSALMCDLDHFKQINDRYGHGSGDDVLAAVGAVLATSLRASDFAGRFGGEEFIVLLPDTRVDQAQVTAEVLRAAIAATRVAGIDDTVTISIGIAALPDHSLDADSLLRAADRALFAAKTAGRNRVQVSTTESSSRRRANAPVHPNGNGALRPPSRSESPDPLPA